MNNPTDHPTLEPSAIVIFGITGDLAQRKLLPALYHLVKDNLLHEHTVIVGVSRRNVSAKELLDKIELCVNELDGNCDEATLKRLYKMVSMVQVDMVKSEDYRKLLAYVNGLEEKQGLCLNRLYYLSIPPLVYVPVIRQLGEQGLNKSCHHGTAKSRLLVEKPFGYDLTSAQELITETNKYFNEDQIFRIDHYVAKEMVQNILTFRFSNALFANIWDNAHIDHISIIAKEKIGIEGRVTFYEETGAVRDFVQSHLLQLLAILTMEKPKSLDADNIHMRKLQLLKSIAPINDVEKDSVRGQYDSYREEVKNPDSTTETFVWLRLSIDNDRWRDVPVTLLTGKALDEKKTELRITFKPSEADQSSNILSFHVQPAENVELELQMKTPGFNYQTKSVNLKVNFAQAFNNHGHPDAYERVLVDAVRGDHTLFATSEEVLAAWNIVDPIIWRWANDAIPLAIYTTGTAGPKLPR